MEIRTNILGLDFLVKGQNDSFIWLLLAAFFIILSFRHLIMYQKGFGFKKVSDMYLARLLVMKNVFSLQTIPDFWFGNNKTTLLIVGLLELLMGLFLIYIGIKIYVNY